MKRRFVPLTLIALSVPMVGGLALAAANSVSTEPPPAFVSNASHSGGVEDSARTENTIGQPREDRATTVSTNGGGGGATTPTSIDDRGRGRGRDDTVSTTPGSTPGPTTGATTVTSVDDRGRGRSSDTTAATTVTSVDDSSGRGRGRGGS
jgi:hypothetical protein